LYEQGYVVVAVDRGSAALSALENDTFDAMVIDGVLPDMTGLQLAEAASTRCVSILISGAPEVIDDARENHRYPFLQKPFHLFELESALRDLLNPDNGFRSVASTRAR
jgi:two-component system, cell cycle response regulator CpdR